MADAIANPIPLSYGPTIPGTETNESPLMTLVDTDPAALEYEGIDEREFRIELGGRQIGILAHRKANNSYDLRWLLTGGCLSGTGTADLNSETDRASIAAHVFELLAHDLRVYITETAEVNPEVGKTYRIEKDNGCGSVIGSTFTIISADAHEFHCESNLRENRGAFGIEDFRHQVAAGELVEVK